jgi:hypothetical protein
LRHLQLIAVVQDPTVGIDFGGVLIERVLVECQHEVEMIAVAFHLLVSDTHPKPHMSATDDRLVTVVDEDV